jgi:uncharacterized membrane protein YjfL (UPF0719 family)
MDYWGKFGMQILSSISFALLGLIFFGAAFWVINKITPFSVRKEIEEDQNIALAIVIGSVILGIAIILAASIHGG